MISSLSLAEIYRREAGRLHSMADAFVFSRARTEFLTLARHFEELADQAAAAAAPQNQGPVSVAAP